MKNQTQARRWEHIWCEPMATSSNVLDFPISVSSFPWKYRLLRVTSKTPVPVLSMTPWNFPNRVDQAWYRERRACSELTGVSWESGQRWWWLPPVEYCCPWREGPLRTPAPSAATQGSALGWMLWCCCLAILTTFWTGVPYFHFALAPTSYVAGAAERHCVQCFMSFILLHDSFYI